MREVVRLLAWVEKIGEREASLTELSRNSRKAREILGLLEKYDLVRVRRKGRVYLISLNERGLELLSLLRRAEELLKAAGAAPAVWPPAQQAAQQSLPSFAADNPWLAILAERGRARVGV
uniref:ArnR1-like winged helix-turn-helix domain-containing protein n=1 Tax=Thermofilum pendens TaxID=2269 RepID=A0A7C4FB15_THEPE